MCVLQLSVLLLAGSVGSIQSQASSGSMLNQKQSSPNPMSRQSTGLSSTIAEDDSVHSNGSGPASKRGNQSAPTPLEIRNPKPLANGTAGQVCRRDQPEIKHQQRRLSDSVFWEDG